MGRQKAKNNRDLEADLRRAISTLNVRFIVTLLPSYQLRACHCAHLFATAQRIFGSESNPNSHSLHFPIHDYAVPGDIASFDAQCVDVVLHHKRRLAAKGQNVLVHCYGGHGRTGTVVACVLMKADSEIDLDGAISMMREVRGNRMLTNPLQQQFCRVYRHYFCSSKQN